MGMRIGLDNLKSGSENETTPLLKGNSDPSSSYKYNSNDPDNLGLNNAKTLQQQNAQPLPFTVETSKISLFATLTFQWFAPLLHLGNSKEQLNPEDLQTLPLPPSCRTSHVSKLFEQYWSQETHNAKTASVARCLAKAYGSDYLCVGVLKLIHDLSVFVGPIVLNQLIQFLRDATATLSTGLLLTLAVTISQIIMCLCLRYFAFKCYLTALRMRTAVVVAVYKKALKLSSAERQRRSTGQIVNLMTVDAQRIGDVASYLHQIWSSALTIILSFYFLWMQLGPSCLGGVAVIVIAIPINKIIVVHMTRLQKVLMKCRDERVEVNSEVLNGIKVIKLQAWEESYTKKILHLRNTELKQLSRYIIANAIQTMAWTAVRLLVALASFAVYTMLGNTLDVANALTALALFDILRYPLSKLPVMVNNLVEAATSLDRVKIFLLSEDRIPLAGAGLESKGIDAGVEISNGTFVYESMKPMMGGVHTKKDSNFFEMDQELLKQVHDGYWEIKLLKAQLKDAEERIVSLSGKEDYRATPASTSISAHYGDNGLKDPNGTTTLVNGTKDEDGEATTETVEDVHPSELLVLRRIDFSCGRGELIAVVGLVGSGKTTFINSMLGEVKALSGTLAVKGRLAYFPQTPFIMNDTLQRNVTFARQAEDFDQGRYDLAISICALEHDIKLLSGGDQTEIGEKGITLSGGQRARVAMARAVYHDADIYLLDDPLAAVDVHVGKHVFQKCIVDELLLRKTPGSMSGLDPERKSSVILVTNAIQYLSNPHVSKIVVLHGGSVAEVGTYNELCSKPGSLFSSFVSILDSERSNGETKGGNEEDSATDDRSEQLTDQSMFIPGRSNSAQSYIYAEYDVEEEDDKDPSLAKPVDEFDSVTALMTNELQEREKGLVDFGNYAAWFKAAGGIFVLILVLIGLVIDRGADVGSTW
mmetsp:Transcript_32353/g.47555  ORF Transcript_32353/g.47555 Transcript_32353/m.47555 type:complete len:930 (+) Transcript_32353:22-2811(+)